MTDPKSRRSLGRWRLAAIILAIVSLVLFICLIAILVTTHTRKKKITTCGSKEKGQYGHIDLKESDNPSVFHHLTSKEIEDQPNADRIQIENNRIPFAPYRPVTGPEHVRSIEMATVQVDRAGTMFEDVYDGKLFNCNSKCLMIRYITPVSSVQSGEDVKHGMSPIRGPQLFDLRFKNERIAYELSLQELSVFYAGYKPMQALANYLR
ncbi:unnamed protein product [Mytilus edulis]|uniref:Copper amine oxidase catalytic domain-containing protein n=1 Tax=Mytilus edulis TaxID=6550 RepID=A0A8S3T9J3_MYTED|nr:unnamed protein product [Mytilus edulis]